MKLLEIDLASQGLGAEMTSPSSAADTSLRITRFTVAAVPTGKNKVYVPSALKKIVDATPSSRSRGTSIFACATRRERRVYVADFPEPGHE